MRVSTPSFKLASLAVLTVLAACGGGGSDSGAATPGPTATGTGTQGSAGNTIASTDTATQSGSNASANTSTPSGNQASTDAAATRPAADTKPTTPAANGTSGTGTAAAPVAPVRPVPPVIQPAPQTAPEVPKPPVTPVAPVTPAEPAKPVTPTTSAEQQARKTRGEWLPKVNWPVVSIHAAITADGRVLTYGTDYNVRQDSQFRYDVWDPELGTDDASHMLLLNSTKTFLFCSAQILLQDGRMMILGGDLLKDGRVTNRGVKDVNIFDPTSNLLTPARNDMTLPRWYGTATTLPTGEVYIQGGTDGEKHPEIRKADGTFKALTIDTLAKIKVGTNEMAAFENNYPRNFVAPNGKIFGFDPHFMYEIDPYGNAGKGSVKMLGAHWDYPRITEDGKEDWEFYRGWQATSTAVMVRPGLIFQFGGGDMTGNMNNGGPSKATLIDINGDRPKLFDMPALDKTYHWSNATVLADGNVLVSGGSTKNLLVDVEEPINEDAGEINYATMLFNPDTRQWTPGANISEKRLYHSVTLLLPDATVLSTGGGQPGPVDNLNAQIYRPPYLFNADGTLAKRPVLKGEVGSGAVAMVAEPASTFHIETADANDIARVTLVKTGAVTHSFDMEQRFNEVKFRVNGNGLDIELPKNKYLTPPGFYHVFAFNKAGVPSKSRMIRINPSEKAPL